MRYGLLLLSAVSLLIGATAFAQAAQNNRAAATSPDAAYGDYAQEQVADDGQGTHDNIRAVRFTPTDQPFECAQPDFGALAMNRYYQVCICVPGAGWIYLNTDVQCVWR